MNDGSRQDLSANIHGVGLNYRNTVLAGRNHRSTSCDRRSHKNGSERDANPGVRLSTRASHKLSTLCTVRLIVSSPKTTFSWKRFGKTRSIFSDFPEKFRESPQVIVGKSVMSIRWMVADDEKRNETKPRMTRMDADKTERNDRKIVFGSRHSLLAGHSWQNRPAPILRNGL